MLRRGILLARPTRFASAAPEMILERLEGKDAGIAVMSFNRPKAMNSINKNMVQLLSDSIKECKVKKLRQKIKIYCN